MAECHADKKNPKPCRPERCGGFTNKKCKHRREAAPGGNKSKSDAMAKSLAAVLKECDRAQEIHGDMPADPLFILAKLMEESGEYAAEINDDGGTEAMRTELTHVAAVALRGIVALEGAK